MDEEIDEPTPIEAWAEKIRVWLVQEEWFVDATPPAAPKAQPGKEAPQHPGWHFYYNCQNLGGKTFQVMQPRTHEDTVFLRSGTRLGDQHIGSLSVMSDLEKIDFTSQLVARIALVHADLAELRIQDNMPLVIALQRALPYDGLTKLAFVDAVGEITKVHFLVSTSVQALVARHRALAERR